jgi:hypothetical protein
MRALWSSSGGYPGDVCHHDVSYSPSQDVQMYLDGWEDWVSANPPQPTPADVLPVGATLARYQSIMTSREHALQERRRTDHLRRRRPPVQTSGPSSSPPAVVATGSPEPEEMFSEDEIVHINDAIPPSEPITVAATAGGVAQVSAAAAGASTSEMQQ